MSTAMALAGLPLVTFSLFGIGLPITSWHAIIYGALIVMGLIIHTRKLGLHFFRLLGVQIALHAVAMVAVSLFDDLGGDGMGAHQEGVLALSSEWNPLKDPYFLEARDLQHRYPVLEDAFWTGRGMVRTFSYVTSAVISKATNFHEAGKSIHLLTLWMAFCGAMSFATLTFRRKRNRWVFAALVAFNPVIGYQFLSYWQDGVLAGVYTSLLMCGAIWVMRPRSVLYGSVFAILTFLISGLKLSGVGFAGISAFGVYFMLFYRGAIRLRHLIPIGLLNLFLIGLAGVWMGAWTFQYKTVDPMIGKLAYYGSEEVNAGGASFNQVAVYGGMNRYLVFLSSMTSRTSVVPYEVEWKVPLTMSWDELRVFYYFFEDPRAGGLGVFFGGLLLMGIAVFVSQFRTCPTASWLVLAMLTIVLLPLAFVPTYWARWIPHTWLLPLLLILPAWLDKEKSPERGCFTNAKALFSWRWLQPSRWVGAALVLAFANIALIFIPYTFGNVFGSYVLRQQLELIECLPKPLRFGNGDYPSNRNWLIQRGLSYRMTWDSEDWKKPYVQFYRTNTRIIVEPADLAIVTPSGLTLEAELRKLQRQVGSWQPGQWNSEIWMRGCE